MAQTAKLISTDELRTMSSEEYMVIDIRGKYSYSFGHIDGAVLVSSKLSDEELSAQLAEYKDKKLIVCGNGGIMGGEFAEQLCSLGFEKEWRCLLRPSVNSFRSRTKLKKGVSKYTT